MTEPPEDAAETPMARALRLRQAALKARPGPPSGAGARRASDKGVAAGASKPWMKK